MVGDAEQRGAGVRELHQRLKQATTRVEFEQIAAEAQRRRGQPNLQPPIEVTYALLVSLARRHAAGLDRAAPDKLERSG